jgi:NUMOD3 motif
MKQETVHEDFYVYLHCRPNGDPFYVGKGRGPRAFQLRRSRNAHHQSIVSKYGADRIGIFVFHCGFERNAMHDERTHIAQLRAEGYELANKTDGGDGFCGGRHTEESRAKISAAMTGNRHSVGRTDGRGRKLTPEQLEVHRRVRMGKKASPETRAKMSASHIGLNTWSKGRPSPTKGIPHTEEAKAKMRAAWKAKRNG